MDVGTVAGGLFSIADNQLAALISHCRIKASLRVPSLWR
jgi:hypothetical protein